VHPHVAALVQSAMYCSYTPSTEMAEMAEFGRCLETVAIEDRISCAYRFHARELFKVTGMIDE
jgi:hypothetical protein